MDNIEQIEWNKAVQAIENLAKEICEIYNRIKKIVKKVFYYFQKCYITIYTKAVQDKKACKCLHIWLHTKKQRIRKKQIKKLNKFIINYMPF